jgi:hypothetical protein
MVINKCINDILCKTESPIETTIDNKALCLECDMFYGKYNGGPGKLNIKESTSCCFCFKKQQKCIKQTKCDHYLCITCFKKIYNLTENKFTIKIVNFPYPEVEEEYNNDPYNEKWNCVDYQLIQQFNDNLNDRCDKEEYYYSVCRQYLKKCPECYKKKCWYCDKQIQSIGTSRLNGACHDDWKLRTLHKKCFKELVNIESHCNSNIINIDRFNNY